MTISTWKEVTTRMPHECFGCKDVHPKGSKMTTGTEKVKGTLSNFHLCGTCRRLIDETYDEDDTIPYGEVRKNDPDNWAYLDRKLRGLTLADLKRHVDHAVTHSQRPPETVPVLITTAEPSIGERASAPVLSVGMGFDWEMGQFRLAPFDRLVKDNHTEAPLTHREGVGYCCGECARKIAKDDLFCRHCGRKVKR